MFVHQMFGLHLQLNLHTEQFNYVGTLDHGFELSYSFLNAWFALFLFGQGNVTLSDPVHFFPVLCWHSLRERLRTHKFFTKDQCFHLNYHKFSIKSYVLDVY